MSGRKSVASTARPRNASTDRPRTLALARDLIGVPVVSASGKQFGHVIDLEINPGDDFRVIALELGRFGWLDRLHVLRPVTHGRANSEPMLVAWSDVERLDGRRIVLKSGVAPSGG